VVAKDADSEIETSAPSVVRGVMCSRPPMHTDEADAAAEGAAVAVRVVRVVVEAVAEGAAEQAQQEGEGPLDEASGWIARLPGPPAKVRNESSRPK